MKTQKITALALAGVIAVSLCGCNNDTQSSDSANNSSSSTDQYTSSQTESTENSSESSSENSESDSSPSNLREKIVLIGALIDEIDHSEIVKAIRIQPGENIEIAPERIDEDRADSVVVRLAYCALPLYPCLTDRESEFDEDNRTFKDVPIQKKSDFIKVKPGDKICGFTVSEASTDFYIGNNGGRIEMSTTHIKLNGTTTIDGYIRILTESEYATGGEGDIIFIPVGNVRLPVIRLDERYENRIAFRDIGNAYMMEDLIYTNEFSGFFDLGNVNDTTVDLSDIPDDGSFAKVKVTLSDFEMQSTIDWFTTISAVLEDVTLIS